MSLNSSFTLRHKTAPSRVVFGAHQTNFGQNRCFGERHAAYYAARAAGGAGMIVLEPVSVHESDWPYEYALIGYDPAVKAGFERMANAIHEHNKIGIAQLTHTGGQGSSHYSQLPLWAPSPVPNSNSREVPQIIEPGEIEAVTAGFAQTAAWAVEGGLDGVELNAGQDSLLRQFLSGLTNMRADQYGGSLENRLRFLKEVLIAVRARVGREPLVGLKLCGDEYAPWAGIKPEDGVEIALEIVGDEQIDIDYLTITSGSIFSGHMTRAGLFAPPGHAAHLAADIRAALRENGHEIPVIAQGSIVDVAMAAELIAGDRADLVEMTRALISDPQLPKKVATGDGDRIRPCILCNQSCVVTSIMNPVLSCVHNPAAGYETESQFAPLRKAKQTKDVLIIGGGPAGLEAARVAAERGHRVTLFEKGDRLGGTLTLAAGAPGRARLQRAIDWLVQEIERLGVTVKTGVAGTSALIDAESRDAIIVATGGRSQPYPHLADPDRLAVSVRDLLAGKLNGRLNEPGLAVILDEVGDQAGANAAEWLADKGWQVNIVSKDMYVSQRLAQTNEIVPWKQRAPHKNVTFLPQHDPTHVAAETVRGVDLFDRSAWQIDNVSLVISATHELPEDTLYFDLKSAGYNVTRIGDSVAPRQLSHAILEGYRAGYEV